jgi:energy-coupling factor transporter transmembrane protein EcfT
METLINLYINLTKTVKVVQERIKRYYDAKRSRGLDLKEGDKV